MRAFEDVCNDIRKCQRCTLYQGIREYVPGILGSKHPRLVVIGEAPGAMEDITGEPFKGKSGAILDVSMEHCLGLKRGEYTILNSVKCRPPENRDPSDWEKKRCRVWLMEQLEIIQPTLILTLGVHGAHAVTGDRAHMGTLRSQYFSLTNWKCDVIPTYHPMATAYVKARKEDFLSDLSSVKTGEYRGIRKSVRRSLPIDASQSPDSSSAAL